MNRWVLRAIGMSIVHIAARTVLGIVIVEAPLHGTTLKFVALAIVLLVALIWAGIDGIIDARRHEDPDDRTDLIMVWIKAGVVTALISGLVCYIIDQAGVPGIGATSLFFELTSGAAGTALMIIAPAAVGLLVGRWLGRREQKKSDRDEELYEERESHAAHA